MDMDTSGQEARSRQNYQHQHDIGIPLKNARTIFSMLDTQTQKNVRLVSSSWRSAIDSTFKPNGILWKPVIDTDGQPLYSFESTLELLKHASFSETGFGTLKVQNCVQPLPDLGDLSSSGFNLPKCDKLVFGHGNSQINIIKILTCYCDSYCPSVVEFGSDCFTEIISHADFKRNVCVFALDQVKELTISTYESTRDPKSTGSEFDEEEAYIVHMSTLLLLMDNLVFINLKKLTFQFNKPCRLIQSQLTNNFLTSLKHFLIKFGSLLKYLDVSYKNEKWTRIVWDSFVFLDNVTNVNVNIKVEHTKSAVQCLVKSLDYASHIKHLNLSYPFRELHPLLQRFIMHNWESLESITVDSFTFPPHVCLFQFHTPPRFARFDICANLTRLNLTNARIVLDLRSPLLTKLFSPVETLRILSIEVAEFQLGKYNFNVRVPDEPFQRPPPAIQQLRPTRGSLQNPDAIALLDENQNLVTLRNFPIGQSNNTQSSEHPAATLGSPSSSLPSPSRRTSATSRRFQREPWRLVLEWITFTFPKLEELYFENNCKCEEEEEKPFLEEYQIQSFFYIAKFLRKVELCPKSILVPLDSKQLTYNKSIGITVKGISKHKNGLHWKDGYLIQMTSRENFKDFMLNVLMESSSSTHSVAVVRADTNNNNNDTVSSRPESEPRMMDDVA